ncbi:hypothetical protein AgCh_003841 [Apium graveolens]
MLFRFVTFVTENQASQAEIQASQVYEEFLAKDFIVLTNIKNVTDMFFDCSDDCRCSYMNVLLDSLAKKLSLNFKILHSKVKASLVSDASIATTVLAEDDPGSKNHIKHFQASTILKNTSQAFKKDLQAEPRASSTSRYPGKFSNPTF